MDKPPFPDDRQLDSWADLTDRRARFGPWNAQNLSLTEFLRSPALREALRTQEAVEEMLTTIAEWHDEAMRCDRWEAFLCIERDFPRGDLDALLTRLRASRPGLEEKHG